MKIALTTPNFWPYVRRGTARYISTLSDYLIKKGHLVTIITAKPGKSKVIRRNGIKIKYYPFIQHPLLIDNLVRYRSFALPTFWSFCRDDYDLIYCMHFPDGFAAYLAGKFKNIRYLLNVTSVPFRKYWGASSINEAMFRKSIFAADGLLLPSMYSAACMRDDYGVSGETIPMPVDTEYFSLKCSKDSKEPIILFVSELNDQRKGLLLLLKAFYLFKKSVPGAILLLAGQTDPYAKRRLFAKIPQDVRRSVIIYGQGRLDDLPLLYAKATMTILPSMHEVFGMVLLESLSSGTPVIGCNSGAIPEIINSQDTGRLFDPIPDGDVATNVSGLYDAMMDIYDLAQNKKTDERCREHARCYDISVIGEKIEKLLLSIC